MIFLVVKFATFEITIYILGSLGFGKVQNLHLQRGRLKRTRNNIKKDFFLVGLRNYLL